MQKILPSFIFLDCLLQTMIASLIRGNGRVTMETKQAYICMETILFNYFLQVNVVISKDKCLTLYNPNRYRCFGKSYFSISISFLHSEPFFLSFLELARRLIFIGTLLSACIFFFSALASALCPIVKSQVSLCHFIYISVPRKLMSVLLSVLWLSSLFASSFRRSVYTSFSAYICLFQRLKKNKKTN